MVESFSSRGIQLLCMLVMAQFLSPEEFGLISMLSIFLALSTIIIDAGFGQALIREQNVSQEDYSSVYFFNIIVAILLYLVFFLLAPVISSFYDEPKLTSIIRVSFLSLIIYSTTVVQQARFYKSVDFEKVSKVTLISVVLSGVAGIVMAWLTHSEWAIVAQSLSMSVIRSLTLSIIGKWRPWILMRWKCIKKYLEFSLNLLGANIIAAVTDNLPNLFIGKSYSASVLGGYSVPDKLQVSVAGTLSFSIHRVSYPIMSSFQYNKAQLSEYSQKVVDMAFFIIAPIMMYMMIESQDIFDILLPEAWSESARYFQYMSVIGAVYCFADINMDVLKVRGKTREILYIEIVRKAVFVAVLVVGVRYSIETLLCMLIGYNIFNALFVSYFYGRSIDCPLSRQIKNIRKTILSLVAAMIVGYSIAMFDLIPIVRLLLSAIGFACAYIFCAIKLKDQSISFINSYISKIKGVHA